MRSRIILLVAVLLCFSSSRAQALPAFARQTGQECSACHVGSFGPQLTPFGRDFKLNGYVMGEAKNKLKNFSAMVFGGVEHTKGDLRKGTELSGKTLHFDANNNVTVDQASLFYGGQLSSHLGMFSQVTYSGIDDAVSWDNVDVRFADNTMAAGKDLVYGVTWNNNPSVQDLWQTVPAWGFPYASSGLAPTPATDVFMSGLGQTVGGLGAYTMWNSLLYTEFSGYVTLSDGVQKTLGQKDVATSDHLSGINPYWRAALQHDFGQHYVSVGTFGMESERFPSNDHTAGTDKLLDTALDATYQFTSADSLHSVSLYGSAIHEHQNLKATFALTDSTNSSNSLDSYHANASYYYKNAYGVTLGRFATKGSTDAILYPDASNHRPDSAGWTVQFDITPLGTEKSIGWPYLNARVFAQYTAYDKFDGLSKNYDGTGRNASDNNTLFVGTWFAF